MEKRLRDYLFERHSLAEISDWYQRLRFFRYFRAYGGHANDGDSLDFAIGYDNEKELLDIFSRLLLVPKVFDQKPEQPISGKSYSHEDFDKFPSLIENTQWIEQPGRTKIGSHEAFVWVYADRVQVSAGSGFYEVTEETVSCAEEIERAIDLAGMKEKIIDPPKDTIHYISPKNYQLEFSEQGASHNERKRPS